MFVVTILLQFIDFGFDNHGILFFETLFFDGFVIDVTRVVLGMPVVRAVHLPTPAHESEDAHFFPALVASRHIRLKRK